MRHVPPPDARPYPIANSHSHARDHHDGLNRLLNPFTMLRLGKLADWTGKHCLEIGAGAGDIAYWWADRVGPDGGVVAVDKDTSLMFDLPGLSIEQVDLLDEHLPAGPFDGIHSRLVLNHLPNREELLRQAADRLAPGGWLVEESWDATNIDVVRHAANQLDAAAYATYQKTLGEHVLAGAGTDRAWARGVHGHMLDMGLEDVHTEVHATYWTGGGPGMDLGIAMTYVLRDQLNANGISDDDLDNLRRIMRDPATVIAGHPLISTAGRKPRT